MKIKLFCFPHAGASSALFYPWRAFLDPAIELVPVELSGRGSRFTSPLCKTMEEVIEDVYKQLPEDLADHCFAFFGHSMGSLIAFELTHTLVKRHQNLPMHLFFSGNNAPQYNHLTRKLYNLPEAQLINELLSLGGTAPEVFANPELQQLFMPILRSDLKISDTYCLRKERAKLDVSFSVLHGETDSLLVADGINGWQEHTSRDCRIFTLEGGHMYLIRKADAVADIINERILN